VLIAGTPRQPSTRAIPALCRKNFRFPSVLNGAAYSHTLSRISRVHLTLFSENLSTMI